MTEHLSGYAIIIAIISLCIAGVTFMINFKQSKMQQLSSESQFIQEIQKELTDADTKFFKIKTQTDCLLHISNYLNTLDRLCYFDSKGWLSEDIMNYFNNYLSWGLKYYNWAITSNIFPKKDISKMLPNIESSCKKHNIQEHEKPIPQIFKQFNDLPSD